MYAWSGEFRTVPIAKGNSFFARPEHIGPELQKKLNDTHGHIVGSRALCRLADVLRAHCRKVDTPARFGGDEFAVVLPETTSAQAQQIATRIREHIASDGEAPPISAAVGSAVFPDDG